MDLPISVVFEPPSQAELRALLRRRRMWVVAGILALAIGLVLVVACVSRAEAQAAAGGIPLSVTSRPSGAAISIDGQPRGRTPALVQLAPGPHRLRLQSEAALDAEYAIQVAPDGGELDAVLWRRQPSLRRLRPALPGAQLDAVYPLADGRLALVTRTHADAALVAWGLDPRHGHIEPLNAGLAASRLGINPDGARLAFIGPEIGPSVARSTWFAPHRPAGDPSRRAVWHAPAAHTAHAAPRAVWRAPAGEALLDLSWSPVADMLLTVTGADPSEPSPSSRLFMLRASGDADAQELLSLPSGVVPGAYAWSPDGQHVVFMAHAGSLNALCLLDANGGFRYLADLDASATPPLPYPPVAWSVDSRQLVFVAPRQQSPTPAEGWLSGPPRRALYVFEMDASDPRLIAEVDAEVPAWREDGRILLLSRQREDGTLVIQLLDDAGQHVLLRLPLRVGPRYAAAWNTRTGHLLVADATSSGTEFWSVGLALEPIA